MSFIDFIKESRNRPLKQNIGEIIVGYRRRSGWLEKRSTHIYERDWDVLCILDACRYDLFAETAADIDYINEVESMYSVGATSPMWMERTFGPLSTDQLQRTAYLTGNPWSSRLNLEWDSLAVFDELWQTTWDNDIGYQPPRPLTDRAISLSRERDDIDRLIIHYMQPHVPFINHSELSRKMGTDTETPDEKTVWKKVRDGELDRNKVWEAYKDNLKYVLEEINLLRKNLNVDTLALSADHGNAMGELGQAGHEYGTLVKTACEVPWVEVDCQDRGNHDPSYSHKKMNINSSEDQGNDIASDRLSALGYI